MSRFATKADLEKGLDTARQYAETLFSKSTQRITKVCMDQIEDRLRTALATIRPEPKADEKWQPQPLPPRRMVPPPAEEVRCQPSVTDGLRAGNAAALKELEKAVEVAAREYEQRTGMHVRHVVMDRGAAKPTVNNP